MSNGSAFGTGFGYDTATDPATEMHAFDRLAPELRALLNYSTLDYSAAQLARLRAGGVQKTSWGAIETPDERGPVIEKIKAVNAAHEVDPEAEVARATLRRDRPVARSRRVLPVSRLRR